MLLQLARYFMMLIGKCQELTELMAKISRSVDQYSLESIQHALNLFDKERDMLFSQREEYVVCAVIRLMAVES